jgi:hypothetical protein
MNEYNFTMYDLRGEWATQEDKEAILDQLNNKLVKMLKDYQKRLIDGLPKVALPLPKHKLSQKNIGYNECLNQIKSLIEYSLTSDL